MALIFDRFPSMENAASFAGKVAETYERDATIHTNPDEAATSAFYPFSLNGTVVLIERFEDYGDEEAIIALVGNYQGKFAGT